MSHDRDIAELTARIHQAESDRDRWRATGNQEKYLQSYFLAEALELQRDRLRKQRLRSMPASSPRTRA